MLNNRFVLIVLSVVMNVHLLSAQTKLGVYQMTNMMPQEIKTPTAASLGIYGNAPVSYNSGRVNISVPIYSTEVRGVPLDISLDYNSSGVLVNTLPGWAGQNWTLNAGGVITRTVNNVADEMKLTANEWSFLNYFQSYKLLNSLGCDSVKVREYSMGLDKNICEYDFSADVFTFNFMGKTGRFFLGNDGEWKVDSDWNIDVEFDTNASTNYVAPVIQNIPGAAETQPKTIRGFRLRDEEGTLYEFGDMSSTEAKSGGCNATEYSVNIMPMDNGLAKRFLTANAWYLHRVTDRFGNVLYGFEYERGCFMAQFYNYYERYIYDDSGCWGTKSYTDLNNGTFPFSAILNMPVYLSGISCGNGVTIHFGSTDGVTVNNLYNDTRIHDKGLMASYNNIIGIDESQVVTDFAYPFIYLQTDLPDIKRFQFPLGQKNSQKRNFPLMSAAIRQLKEISVWDISRDDRTRSKKFRLRHSGEPRFFLNEIDIFSFADKEDTADTVFIGKYKFTYNDGDKLPGNYATTAADHWGYYNQREYTLADCNRADFYNLRNPNPATMQYGSLRSMTYPTGGTTVLEYEPHDYSHYISDTRDRLLEKDSIAGGLRIKRITDYEDETCKNVLSSRTFSYVANGKSSGTLYAKPKYFWPRWAMKARSGGAVKSASMAMFRSSSIIPLANALHPHVTYSQVEETNADGSRNIYKFTDGWTGNDRDEGFFLKYHDTATSPYDHFSEKSFARGRLKEKTMYDVAGKLVCRETYKDTLCNDTQKDFVITSGVIPFFSDIIAGGLYKLYYQKSRPSSVVRCTATQTVNIKETSSWQYKRTELGLTSGKRHKGQAFVMTKAWKTRGMTSIGSMYAYPFENADSVLRNWALSRYFLVPNIEKQFENGSHVKTVDCKYSKVTKGDKMFVAPYMVTVTTPQNVSDTLVTYLAYTKTGQLQCYRQAGQSATSLLWGMGDNFLMMKCENLNLSNTDVVQFVGDGFFDIDNVLGIQKKFRNTHSAAQTTSYTYAPTCGVTSITTPDGKTTYYNYAPGMRLSEVLDNNSKPLQRYEYNFRNR